MNNQSIKSFLILILLTSCSSDNKEVSQPVTKKIDFIETIHGYQIEDQYRWLEDFTSEDSKKWVEKQNQ